jgi:N6-adenosine-specific RNA methylase IME4
MTQHRTTVIDPPWPERGGGKSKRGADKHYPLLRVSEMPRVILGASCWQPTNDAHLYIWATNTHLMAAGWLMGALGFEYKTCLTWEKETKCGRDYAGLGQYFRGSTEHLIFGTRGRGYEARTARRDIKSLLQVQSFKALVGEHSEKPEEAYELVQARSQGPYLEMFARAPRTGWAVWGNELMVA